MAAPAAAPKMALTQHSEPRLAPSFYEPRAHATRITMGSVWSHVATWKIPCLEPESASTTTRSSGVERWPICSSLMLSLAGRMAFCSARTSAFDLMQEMASSSFQAAS